MLNVILHSKCVPKIGLKRRFRTLSYKQKQTKLAFGLANYAVTWRHRPTRHSDVICRHCHNRDGIDRTHLLDADAGRLIDIFFPEGFIDFSGIRWISCTEINIQARDTCVQIADAARAVPGFVHPLTLALSSWAEPSGHQPSAATLCYKKREREKKRSPRRDWLCNDDTWPSSNDMIDSEAGPM